MALGISASLRGARYASFDDYLGMTCSAAEFIGGSQDLLRVGTDQAPMILTQEMAADLIPLLQHFVETGGLPNGEVSS